MSKLETIKKLVGMAVICFLIALGWAWLTLIPDFVIIIMQHETLDLFTVTYIGIFQLPARTLFCLTSWLIAYAITLTWIEKELGCTSP